MYNKKSSITVSPIGGAMSSHLETCLRNRNITVTASLRKFTARRSTGG